MRSVGLLLLVVLLAVAIASFLRVYEAQSSLEAVESILPALADPSATPSTMDPAVALRLCDDLERLSRDTGRIRGDLAALRAAGDMAAGWAAGANPTSAEHLAAVEIRSAVNDLRAVTTGSRGGPESARAHIARARDALTNRVGTPVPATEALRSRIQGLEQRQRELHQDLQEELLR
jgi:hypothetical protein